MKKIIEENIFRKNLNKKFCQVQNERFFFQKETLSRKRKIFRDWDIRASEWLQILPKGLKSSMNNFSGV